MIQTNYIFNIMEHENSDEPTIITIYDEDHKGEEIIQSFEKDMDELTKDLIPSHSEQLQLYDENSPLTMSRENSDDEIDDQFYMCVVFDSR